MRPVHHLLSAAAAAALVSTGLAVPATAACKKMGFLVNDYGKDGPTADAKRLLDEHIAKWAVEKGIAKFTVSKKDVSCELFLNLIVVDEHTCTASATVCWDEKAGAAPAGTTAKAPADAAAKTAAKTETNIEAGVAAEGEQKKALTETGTVPAAAEGKDGAKEQAKDAAAVAPVKIEAKEEAQKPAVIAPANAAQGKPMSEKDAAAAALAAAERAAAAAERAAQAAEEKAQAVSAGAAGSQGAGTGQLKAVTEEDDTPLPEGALGSPAP